MEIQQSYQDYADYVKCGEILKSPLHYSQNSIILKCLQCRDIHFLLDSFITHIEEHFKNIVKLDANEKNEYENSDGNVKENEENGIDAAAKFDEIADPLFSVKNDLSEGECGTNSERNEVSSQHSETSFQEEDQYEDVFDNTDEFRPSDSEIDDDEIIKKPKKRKRTVVKGEHNCNDSETEENEILKKSPYKRKRNSPVVDEFMKSKTNVLTLIDLYKNQSDLWNKYSPYYTLRERRKQLFDEITENLNKKCSLELTCNQTAEIISYICGKHRDDCKRVQGQEYTMKKGKKRNNKQGKYKTKLDKNIKRCWFYDDLYFLRSKALIHLQNLDANLPDLTPEQIIQIIEIYKSIPTLWNTDLIEYICSNKRRDALVEMLNILQIKLDLKTNTNTLEQYICTIHNYFSKEKRQSLETSTTKEPTKNDISNYYEQMSFLENHEGPFYCSECNGLYNKPLCFKVHKSQHDGSVPFICSQCKKEFKTVASYTTHAKRHLDDFQFICTECNMKFLKHSDLKKHLPNHTGATPYCCEICGASYRLSNSFRKHRRRHENRFSYTCQICFKGYHDKYRYVDHMNSHMNIRSHVCKICEKAFITRKALLTHSVTHVDERNHACKVCGKTFKLKIGVLQHMRTHKFK